MDVPAKVTSKGQMTLPKTVREALDLQAGDTVLFRVVGGHALLARTPNLLELAGSIPVTPQLRGAPWTEIRERAHRAQSERSR